MLDCLRLRDGLKRLISPPTPGEIYLFRKVQLDMSRFQYEFSLPGPSASDVASSQLTITNTEFGDVVLDLPGTPAISPPVVIVLPNTFTLSLKQIDATGNMTLDARTRTFSEVDDVAPPTPDDIAIASKVQLP